MQQESIDSIVVLIRIRPFNERERQDDDQKCFRIDEQNKNTMIFDANFKTDTKTFTFDHVCPEHVSQEEIFRVVGIPSARSCLQGYNGCIFAYGQTGAGKTYTIQGPTSESGLNLTMSAEGKERVGILPRVVEYMFSDIESVHDTSSNVAYNVKCSFLEIYNEQIIDLLNPSTKGLQVREDLKKGVYVEGQTEFACSNAAEAMEVVRVGNRARHIGATNMNIESSRSHSVFTFAIESRITKEGVTNVRTSRFSFVDLAGSERQKLVGTNGDRLKEGCLINKSLMVLANVINSLVDISDGKSRFVHYRDSKLTFLLKDSLGGNAKTSIIANISPASCSLTETLSTLKFAQRAKLIKSKVKLNETTSGTLESLKNEILRLRQELAFMRSLNQNGSVTYDSRRTPTKFGLEFDQSLCIYPNQSQNDSGWVLDESAAEEMPRMRGNESGYKQALDMIMETELNMVSDFNRKEDLIEKLKGVSDVYSKNELQMKMVIKLLKDKAERFKTLFAQKVISKEEFLSLIEEEEKNDLRGKMLQVLKEPEWEMKNDESKEFADIREENRRLREEYFNVVEALAAKESQLAQAVADGQSLSEVGEENNEEGSLARLPSEDKDEFEKLRSEYEKLIGEYEILLIKFEEKNEELKKVKEDFEKLAIEKKELAETLTREYNEKVETLKAEQKVNLEKSEEEALWMREENIDLQKKLYKSKDEVTQNEEKYKSLKSHNDKLISELEILKEEKVRFEAQVQEEKEESQNNLNKYEEKEKEYQEVQANYLKTREDYISLQREVENVKTLFTELQSDNSNKEQEIHEVKKNLSEKENELANFQVEHSKVVDLNETLVSDIESLKKGKIEVEQKLIQSQTDYEAKIQEVENKNNIKLEELTTENSDLKVKLENFTKMVENMTQDSTNKDEENNVLKLCMSNLEKDLQTTLQKLQESQEEMQSLRSELAENVERFKILTNEKGHLEESFQNLEERNSHLKETVQNLEDSLMNKTQKLQGFEIEISTLKAELTGTIEMLTVGKEQFGKQLIESQNEFASIETKYQNDMLCLKAEFTETIEMLKTEKEKQSVDSQNEISTLKTNKEQLEKELRDSQNDLVSIETKYQNDINSLRAEFTETLKTLNVEKENQVIDSQNEILTLKAELTETIEKLTVEKDQLEKQLIDSQSEFATIEAKYQKLEGEDLKLTNEENFELKETIKSLEDNLKNKTQKLQEVETELSYKLNLLTDEKEQLQKQLGDSRGEYMSIEARYQKLEGLMQEENSRFVEMVKTFEEKTQKLEEVEIELSERVHVLTNEKNELEEQLSNSQNEYVSIEAKYQKLEGEDLKLSEEENSKLKETIKNLESEMNERILMKEKELEEVRAESEKFQNECFNRVVEIESVSKDYKAMQIEFAEKQQRIEELERETDKLQKENSQKQKEIICLKEERQELLNDISNKTQEAQILKQDLLDLQSQTISLEEKKEEQDDKLIEKTEEVESLLLKLTMKEQEMENLDKLYQKIQEEKTRIEMKLEEVNSENMKLMKDIESLETLRGDNDEKVARSSREYNKLTIELGKMIEELALKNQKLGSLEIEVLNSKEENEQNEKKIKILEQDLAEKYDEIDAKDEQLRTKLEEVGRIQEELKRLTATCKRLSIEKSTSDALEESLKAEINKLSEEKDVKIAKLERDMKTYEAKQAEMTKELTFVNNENEKLVNEREKIVKELNEVKKNESELAEENQQYLEELTKLEHEWQNSVQEVEAKKLELAREYKMLKEELSSKANELNELTKLREDHKTLKTMQAQWTQEKENYVNNEKSYNENLKKIKDQYLKLSNELETLKTEIANKDHEIITFKNEHEDFLNERDSLYQEINGYKDMEPKLRQEISEYSEKISGIYEQQESEINQMKDQYLKLAQDHKNLTKTILLKDDQLAKIRDEMQHVFLEKEKLMEDLKTQKMTEVKLKKEKQEYYEKVTRLNNDQYLLLKEIDNLNKANEGAANQNNMAQKIKHLNKLKEENNELKTEKAQLCEDLALAIDQRDTLQKKLDDQTFMKGKQDNGSQDFEKRNVDSQILVESLSRINSIVYTNLHKEDSKFFVPKVKDIESTLRGVQILCALIMEKNNRIRNRESELESTLLTNSILEKEVLLLKQKINLGNSEPVSQNESVILNKSQHPPLDLRNKNRMPTPTRMQNNNESFYKVAQQSLNSSHRAGSAISKRQENEIPGFDENLRSNPSDIKKFSHLPRNPAFK